MSFWDLPSVHPKHRAIIISPSPSKRKKEHLDSFLSCVQETEPVSREGEFSVQVPATLWCKTRVM